MAIRLPFCSIIKDSLLPDYRLKLVRFEGREDVLFYLFIPPYCGDSPGVMHGSAVIENIVKGLEYLGMLVPETLLSGNSPIFSDCYIGEHMVFRRQLSPTDTLIICVEGKIFVTSTPNFMNAMEDIRIFKKVGESYYNLSYKGVMPCTSIVLTKNTRLCLENKEELLC